MVNEELSAEGGSEFFNSLHSSETLSLIGVPRGCAAMSAICLVIIDIASKYQWSEIWNRQHKDLVPDSVARRGLNDCRTIAKDIMLILNQNRSAAA